MILVWNVELKGSSPHIVFAGAHFFSFKNCVPCDKK